MNRRYVPPFDLSLTTYKAPWFANTMANGCHLPIQWQIKGPNGQYNGKRHSFAITMANQKAHLPIQRQIKGTSIRLPIFLPLGTISFANTIANQQGHLEPICSGDPLDLPMHWQIKRISISLCMFLHIWSTSFANTMTNQQIHYYSTIYPMIHWICHCTNRQNQFKILYYPALSGLPHLPIQWLTNGVTTTTNLCLWSTPFANAMANQRNQYKNPYSYFSDPVHLPIQWLTNEVTT